MCHRSPRSCLLVVLGFSIGLVTSACASAQRPEGGNVADASSAGAAPTPQSFSEQVTLGQTLYGKKCASCHGASGEGAEGPRLVGLPQGALPLDPPPGARVRRTRFTTVLDVADFVVHNMPPNQSGSLSDEEYFSVLAFDLKANGIDLADKKLDGELAKTLVIPR